MRRILRRAGATLVGLLLVAILILCILLVVHRNDPSSDMIKAIISMAILLLGLILLANKLRFRIGRGARRRSLEKWAGDHGGRFSPASVQPHRTSTGVTRAMGVIRASPRDAHVTDWVWADPGGRHVEAFCLTYTDERTLQYVAIGAPALPRVVLDCRDDDALWHTPSQQFEGRSFNHTWSAWATDRRYASSVVHPRMMELLENSPRHLEHLALEDGLLVSRTPHFLDAEELTEHVATMERLVSLIEPFVINQYRTR